MHPKQWRGHRGLRFKAAVVAAAALALGVAACSSSGSSGNGATSGGTKVAGGTATWGLQPSSVPNYIFPFASSTYFSAVNTRTSST